MEPLRLDDLPDEAREELERRAREAAETPEAYALKLVLGGLSASPTSPGAVAPGTWKAWLADVDRREPVEGTDAAAALAEARREREDELGAAISGDSR